MVGDRQTDRHLKTFALSITGQMAERASCWSITINNPTEAETQCEVPGWKLTGQFEQGKEGTKHFQGMLRTPQVRFTAVKKQFPRAHIEVARDAKALSKYVHKDETRVDVYTPSDIPSIFQYQTQIAKAWRQEEWKGMIENVLEGKMDEMAMNYVDMLVRRDIEAGKKGCEWIAINPMWRSSWKKFWRSIIKRDGTNEDKQRSQGGDIIQEADGGQESEANEGIDIGDKACSE